MRTSERLILLTTLMTSTACTGGSEKTTALPKPPATRAETTATTYFGVSVPDPYRWLENGNTPDVQAWIDAQNKYSESVMAGFTDGPAIAKRVEQLATTSPNRFSPQISGTTLFYLRETPPQPQPVLVAEQWPGGKPRVLVDVNDAGGSTSITGYWPSPTGRFVAFGTGEGGSELTTLRIAEVATGKKLVDALPYAGGGTSPQALAWDADERGMTYARYPLPKPGETVQEFDVSLYHHALGAAPEKDTLAFGAGYSPIAEYRLYSSDDGTQTAALVNKGDGGYAEVFLRVSGAWRRMLDETAAVTDGAFAGDRFLVIATGGSPRGRIVAISKDATTSNLLSEGDWTINAIAPIPGGVLVERLQGPRWRVDHFNLKGELVRTVALPADGIGITGIASGASSTDALIEYSGWTVPNRWVKYDGRSGALAQIFEVMPAADYSKVRSRVIEGTSKDGTRVPVSVVWLADTKSDGTTPTILVGYGGLSIPTAPAFVGENLAWLERGGVLAYANIRGGNEFGEAWHQAGRGAQKQNVFDDFYSSGQALVAEKITTPAHLGILGGSNGGLLMGAEITQHPEAFRAVVSFVGIYDMLRYELFPNGRYNATEFGSTSKESDFRTLFAYSPYHHVKSGTSYPSVFMETGVNDPRVAPWQSRKFAAALQAASAPGRPILLLTRTGAGHGIGAPFSQRVGNTALSLTFLAHELK